MAFEPKAELPQAINMIESNRHTVCASNCEPQIIFLDMLISFMFV